LIKFIDSRDSKKLIITQLYLLLGCAWPFFLTYSKKSEMKCFNNYILAISGCLVLGIGDSFAAIFGSKYGKVRIFKNNKTFVGFLSYVISIAAAIVLLYFYLDHNIRLVIFIKNLVVNSNFPYNYF
jgi:dolichol kinase